MSFANLHKLVAYLLSGLGLLALSLGTELDSTVIILAFVGYVGSVFAEGKLLQHPYYGRAWTLLLAAALVFQILRAMTGELTLSMPIEFAALLQISKLWNRRTAVDYQHIAVLSFLHLIAATVLSTSLSYAVIFIGFVIATPWMLALSQLRREIEGNYPASAPNDERAQAAVRRVLASRRVVGASFLVNTALLAVPLFAMTLTIFVVVPRVGQGFLNLQHTRGQRVAGFGSEVELGGFGVIRDDPTVVLRVTPLPKVDEKAPRMALRLRGTSFDHYDGRRWTRTQVTSQRLRSFDRQNYSIRRPGDPKRDKRLQIVLDHLDEPVVFVPYGSVALTVPARIVHAQQVTRELNVAAGLDIRYDDPDELGLVYTAYLSTDPSEADVPSVPTEQRPKYLQVPAAHEKVAELARQVTAGAKNDYESAQRIQAYLQSSRYHYSLTLPDVGNKPPLEAFLLDAKTGHCEYFASAMAIMLRTLGIPARNVTGFVGGRYNPYGGYYALRQGDAHSWVEAYFEGRGWVTYDPTPTLRAELGPKASLWADLQALLDALKTRWLTSVVGYDLRTQIGILRELSQWFASSDSKKSGAQTRDGVQLDGLKRMGRTIVFGALLLGIAIAGAIWYSRRRKVVKSTRVVRPEAAEVVRLYSELERALQAIGSGRAPSSTPVEHAEALEAAGFSHAAEVRLITESYMRVRYGESSLDESERVQLKAALQRIKREARAEHPPTARAS